MKRVESGESLTARVSRLSRARQMLLARRLEAAGLDAAGLPIVPIQRDAGGACDLSLGQHGLWLVAQLHPENAAYNLAVAMRVEGLLDFPALERSFDLLARRHEVLRVELSAHDGLPLQRVVAAPQTGLVVVDIDGFPGAARWCEEESRRPIKLTGGPLWRATLLRIGEDDHAIVLVIHHIIADNWSMGILGRELGICYTAITRGEAVLLPELPIQYIDFAIWQRRRMDLGALDGELSYWRRRLEGGPPAPRLPADRERPEVLSQRGARRYLDVSIALTESLRALAIKERVTLFMVLVAALQTLLHRHTGADRIIVGTDVAGRGRTEVEGLMGFFVNQLVLCTDLSRNPAFRELLARVREVCLEAYAHQELPFHRLVKVVNPARTLDRTPLFQVKIDLLNIPMDAVSLSGLQVTPIPLEGTAKFDLELILWDTSTGLHGFFEYNTDLFEAPTIDQLIVHLTSLLEQFAKDLDQRILDAPLAGERSSGGGVRFEADEGFSFDA